IQHIAMLARIGLREGDGEKYRQDLSEILDYFKKLDEVDVSGIEPIGHITGMQNVFRADLREDFGDLGKAAILKNVPEVRDGFVKVKSVL
ncbi:MAG: Asp-tRNA(Asn)/Glu-tRNA(Gln) amidotransferase subunit GatC, partial [Candidatus Moraniibacteriota bacterium]